MKVEIWSDVACPWCYIGKRRFEAALARFEHRDEVDVRWRSFELDPSAPPVRDQPYAERLAAKYGTTLAQAEDTIDTMIGAGAAHGVVLRFDKRDLVRVQLTAPLYLALSVYATLPSGLVVSAPDAATFTP